MHGQTVTRPPVGRRGQTLRNRERAFWDNSVPTLEHCLDEYERGPDPNTAAMLDAVEPLQGVRVLDFACGAGVTSAWLAARGARVTGVDLSPRSIERARELAAQLGFEMDLRAASKGSVGADGERFARIVGGFALHHVEVKSVAMALAGRLEPMGTAAFLETIDVPILRVARRHLIGRFGIPRYGTLDEHPITARDLLALKRIFGSVDVRIADVHFFSIFDRQVFRYRSKAATRILGALDSVLLEVGLGRLSYHQVLVLRSSASAAAEGL